MAPPGIALKQFRTILSDDQQVIKARGSRGRGLQGGDIGIHV
jgi:hypothetical protein